MNPLLVLAGAGAISWALRVTFILAFPAGKLPERFRTTLEAAAPAAMAALLTTDVLHRGMEDVGMIPALVLGVAVAAFVTWRFGNLAVTALAGIAVYGLTSALL